jgi:hypothetical protein
MKFFPRLLFLTTILLVVLGFCKEQSGNRTTGDNSLGDIEWIFKDTGITPVTYQIPPVPIQIKLANSRIGSRGRSLPAHERAFFHRCNVLLTRINAIYHHRSPELFNMKGMWIHTTGDVQKEDPSAACVC